jgi:hypothetical protein
VDPNATPCQADEEVTFRVMLQPAFTDELASDHELLPLTAAFNE